MIQNRLVDKNGLKEIKYGDCKRPANIFFMFLNNKDLKTILPLISGFGLQDCVRWYKISYLIKVKGT
jgi:hypothetical protein